MSDHPDDDKTIIAPTGSGAGAPPPEHSNVLPVGTRIGEFEILRLIGEGGFGIVYLCEDRSLGRRVALKEYMPSALASRSQGYQVSVKSERHAETFEAGRRSFVNEARLLAQFDHPGLVKVYRFWEANGTAYMVMPFYEGITLKQELAQRGGAPDEAWLKQLLVPLMQALELLHSAHVFHRDIAPDNILLQDGRPVLLDLGAARRVIGDMTQALTVILKPGYAPVEQYADDPSMKQGAWTDIYALAAVLYLAVVGKTPIPAVGRMMKDGLAPASQLAAGRYSAGFLAAIDRGLAVRPEDRPQSIDEFRALLGLPPPTAGSLPPARPATAAAPPAGAAPRSRTGLVVGGVGLLAALAVGGYFLFAESPAPAPETPPSAPTAAAPAQTPPAAATAPTAAPGIPGLPQIAGTPGTPGRFETTIDDGTGPRHVTVDTDAQGRQTITMRDTDGKTYTMRTQASGLPGGAVPGLPAAARPAPPTVAEAPGPFDPINELDTIFQGRDRDRNVTIELDKARVRIGKDKLSFRLRSNQPGYLYVLMVGTDGDHFYQLFPNAVDGKNQMEAEKTLTLPRPGWTMVAGGPPGSNHFLAIVSDEKRDFSGAGIKKIDPFAEFPLDRAAKVAAAHHAAGKPGSAFVGQPVCSGAKPCSPDYGAAVFTIEEY